jgi:hypothetical protein
LQRIAEIAKFGDPGSLMSRTTISIEDARSVLVVRRRDGIPGHSMRPTTPG